MTVFQLNRSQSTTWTQPTHVAHRPGRHAIELRARMTLRRLFYVARHAAR
ncbi:MAG: hypothetical protein QOK10_2951 [Pseudonocardiales bacterium]|jgi:hypothetical protein|nr:hypothetical protein [Pseudonocardiales bacterium]